MDIKTSIDNPTLITDNIYIGNMTNASNKDSLKSLGITHILICGSYLEAYFPSDFIYKKIEINDLPSDDIIVHLRESYNFIKGGLNNKGVIFIHCAAGISRSTTFLIAYLMKENNWSYSEALNFIKERYQKASPNFGFISQLKRYENQIKDVNLNN